MHWQIDNSSDRHICRRRRCAPPQGATRHTATVSAHSEGAAAEPGTTNLVPWIFNAREAPSMRRLIGWACLAGFVLAGATPVDAQEPWRPEWRSRRAQAELPVPGPEPETAYMVPGSENWEEGSPQAVNQRMSALQAELS